MFKPFYWIFTAYLLFVIDTARAADRNVVCHVVIHGSLVDVSPFTCLNHDQMALTIIIKTYYHWRPSNKGKR